MENESHRQSPACPSEGKTLWHLILNSTCWYSALKVHLCVCCCAQTGVLEYPKEDSMTTMDRVKRFLQRKDGGAPGTPPKPPQASTPIQKRVRA